MPSSRPDDYVQLSPMFNWDTTGMTDEEMGASPRELAKWASARPHRRGHQITHAPRACCHHAAPGRHAGAGSVVAYKMRLVESPYRTLQRSAGRADASYWLPSLRDVHGDHEGNAAPPSTSTWCKLRCRKLLEDGWPCERPPTKDKLRVQLRPQRAAWRCSSSASTAKAMTNARQRDIPTGSKIAAPGTILLVRDQNTFGAETTVC